MPKLGSFIASGDWTAKEIGLEAFPPDDRPPVVIPFFAFRIMVGMGLIMVAISWIGVLLIWQRAGALVPLASLSEFSDRFFGGALRLKSILHAEVGRRPWVVYGLLRTQDAITPSLTGLEVLISLIGYVLVYIVIYAFGLTYIYRLLRRPGRSTGDCNCAPTAGLADRCGLARTAAMIAAEPSGLALFWAAATAVANLHYVILDRFNLGVGIMFRFARMADQDTTAGADRIEVGMTADTHFCWLRTRLNIERTLMSWIRTAVSLIYNWTVRYLRRGSFAKVAAVKEGMRSPVTVVAVLLTFIGPLALSAVLLRLV